MTKQVRRSNVAKGVLVPLGNGFSLAIGKHPEKTDDIDIGPNNKNGLSVNHGEILQQKGNSLRVFSAEPMLGGESPVQLLYGGMAPDKVFAMQEQYKDIYRINDDGSKQAKFGTEKVVRNKQTWDTVLNDEQESAFNDWYKNISSKLKLNSNPDDYNHHYDYRGYWLENKDNNIDYSEKDFHFPDKYKKPTHKTFSRESIYANKKYGIDPKTVGYWENDAFIPGNFNNLINNSYKNLLEKEGFYYKNDEQLSSRQRYAESTFNDKALNKWSKAAGAYQIMPHIHKAYIKATGHKGDLYDLEYNTAIRNWLMDDINKNSHIKDSRNSNRNRLIKTYAAYNWGSGNLGTLLRRLEKEGIDTFNSYDWVNRLPKETKDYVNFIIHGDDVNNVKNNKKYKEALDSLRLKKEFGGQTNINSLGERPNAKFGKEMNKRKNALNGSSIDPFMGYGRKLPNIPFTLTQGVNGYLNPQFKPIEIPKLDIGIKSSIPKVDPFMGMTPTTVNKSSTVTSSGENKGGMSASKMDGIGAGIQMLGNLAAAGIQQVAINNMKVTPHQYTLLNPVKLKTKVNIAPQVAAMRDTVAKLTDAAHRTSASSRTMYQKTMDARRYGDQQISGLLGEKENKETALINQDRLNQQTIGEKNANRVMDTINGNTDRRVNLENEKRRLTSNNWINAINNTGALVDGPNGLIARSEARTKEANDMFVATLPYAEEFQSLTENDFVKKYGRKIFDAVKKGQLIG